MKKQIFISLATPLVLLFLLFSFMGTAADDNLVTDPNFAGGLSAWNVTGCWDWTSKPRTSAKMGPVQFAGSCSVGSEATLTQTIYIPPNRTVISYSHDYLMIGNGNILSTTISGNGFHWRPFYHTAWTPCYCSSPITHTTLPVSDTFLVLTIYGQYNISLGMKVTNEKVTTGNN